MKEAPNRTADAADVGLLRPHMPPLWEGRSGRAPAEAPTPFGSG